jgi:hypothetical protein
MYKDLSDPEFFDLIFSAGDRLGMDFVEEAQRRRETLIPFLGKTLKKEKNYEEEGSGFWGVIHAVHLLGILRDPRSFDGFLSASRFSDAYDLDWIWEALPECYFRLGKEAIPLLMDYIERERYSKAFATSNEIQALWNFWEAHPEERERIEDFLLQVLKDPDVEETLRADLIGDFVELGRRDLKPLFEGFFDRGQVDLDTLSREDLDFFLNRGYSFPGHHYDLEKFYRPEEIERRRKRWAEEKEASEKEEDETYILDNFDRIPRNDPCPCGSGKKFKKCHLAWAEEENRRAREEEQKEEGFGFSRNAILGERRAETQLRQFLAKKDLTPLFAELKTRILEAVKAPQEDFIRNGLNFYIGSVLSRVPFRSEEEAKDFGTQLMAYYSALLHQFTGYPEDQNSIH